MDITAANEILFDAELISRYDGRGPRYTSYPTAVQFTERFNADAYRSNARASNVSQRPLSLYIHIPFCHTLCYYCACNKIVTRNQDRVSHYLENLYREIDMQSAFFAPLRQVEQLHFGGGTPTYLAEQQMSQLLQKLGQAFNFAGEQDREFSIEVDPRTVDDAYLRHLAALGFNRLSLGIQDFDPEVQQAVNRVQSAAQVGALLDTARIAGFKSVSFDLIYGLPLQSVASFARTLHSVIAMQPDRLAVYNYAHLPARFKGQRMIPAQQIPEPQTKLAILQHTIETLIDAGYHYIGMDHFALPADDLLQAQRKGTLQRNFQGYSTHKLCDLVGLGVSSISHIGNCFSQNAVTTMAYEAQLQNTQLPVHKGLEMDSDDLVRADIIQALMCYGTLEFAAIEARHGIEFSSYFATELARLAPLAQDGLLELSQQRIAVMPRGRLLLRNIAMCFDRYIADAGNNERYSRAI